MNTVTAPQGINVSFRPVSTKKETGYEWGEDNQGNPGSQPTGMSRDGKDVANLTESEVKPKSYQKSTSPSQLESQNLPPGIKITSREIRKIEPGDPMEPNWLKLKEQVKHTAGTKNCFQEHCVNINDQRFIHRYALPLLIASTFCGISLLIIGAVIMGTSGGDASDIRQQKLAAGRVILGIGVLTTGLMMICGMQECVGNANPLADDFSSQETVYLEKRKEVYEKYKERNNYLAGELSDKYGHGKETIESSESRNRRKETVEKHFDSWNQKIEQIVFKNPADKEYFQRLLDGHRALSLDLYFNFNASWEDNEKAMANTYLKQLFLSNDPTCSKWAEKWVGSFKSFSSGTDVSDIHVIT